MEHARPHPPRADNPHRETWHIYSGDVHVGVISEHADVPIDADRWCWSCSFYPGLHPGQHQDGSAATFELARIAFEEAWQRLSLQIPVGAFDE
jgi:hypothetical protein